MSKFPRIGFWVLVLSLPLVGCMTPAEERQLKDDIFSLQARLLQMEGQLSNQGKEITTQGSRQEASINARLEKITIEIQRIKGEIDALKVGVTTGQLPGSDAAAENSMGKSVADLASRLDALEENQNKIINAIDKAIDTKKPEKKTSTKSKGGESDSGINDFKEIKAAFDDKQYSKIASEGTGIEKVLASIKSDESRKEATFMVAESYFKTNQYRDAAIFFSKYAESKPKSKKNLPHARLRLADSFVQLKDNETAISFYEEVIQFYPKSPEARQASESLKSLSK